VTTYLLAGGGTAGHVNPLLAIADELRAREPESVVLVLGTREGLESRLVPERGYELLTIPRLPFPRRPNGAALRFPGAFRRTLADIRRMLRERRIDVVVGVGGYAAAPAYLAARRSGIPFVLHEANARPGMANRLGARFTRHVGVVFPGTPLPHATVVGMPLRRELEQLDRASAREEARELFGLAPNAPVLLVTGGSTGARSINRTVAASLDVLLATGWQVLHITGTASELEDPGRDGYRMLRYCDRMELAMAVADLAISRAGATTVAELSLVGVPAVLVPYPVGNGEQKYNARGVVDAGGALLVLDADFTPEWVTARLAPLMSDRERVRSMADAAASVGVPGGSARMADLVARALGGDDAPGVSGRS
jgi:UDP-N-acetylglucosamine--N-acetylmuramyl-(pentapeptide) pyrophosphoryl-undecaprenol N-acetylglucosamine transferase